MKVFDWLFRKKEKEEVEKLPRPSAAQDIMTSPLSEKQLESVIKPQISYKPQQLIMGTAQSIGLQRDHNEDTICAMTSILADEITELPFGIFVVADGMGGHLHGEVASGVAARTAMQYLVSHLYLSILGVDPEERMESLQEIVESAVMEAHKVVLRKAPGGGTTITLGLVLGEQVTLGQVGDSRAYFIYPDGRIQAVTQDHTLVRRLIDLGQLTEEQAMIDSRRNVLYRALGQLEPFKPDIETKAFPNPGYMLLCSDGLWGVVPQADIFRIVRAAKDPSQACHQLIEAANAAGGPDNISAILVQFLN